MPASEQVRPPALAPTDDSGMGNIFDIIAKRLAEAPDRIGLRYQDGRAWTYRELTKLATGWGATVREAIAASGGLTGERQPRALVYLQNSPELVITLLGLWHAGVTAVPVNIMYQEDELRHVIALTQPDIAICAPSAASLLNRAASDLEVLTHVDVVPDAAANLPQPTSPGGDQGPSGDALILMTSGSTGPPKALTVSHQGFLESTSNNAAAHSSRAMRGKLVPIVAEDVPPNLIYWPLFHAGGINALMFAWFVGRSVVVMERFRADRVATLVQQYHVDNLFLLPTMMYDLMDLPDDVRMPSVRSVLVSGQELQPALRSAFEQRFGIPILANYGSTEVGHVAGWTIREIRSGSWKPGSVGKVYEGVEVEIRDADGKPLPPNETGEIWVKTQITSGYVNGKERGGELADLVRDGWVRTRDIGRLDDGVLFLRGRARDMIKCAGFQVWPSEIEEALLRHDAVKEVVVRPVRDTRLGEAPLAAIVLSSGVGPVDDEAQKSLKDDIIEFCRSILAHYKVPRRLVFVDAIPRTEAGKIDKPALDREIAAMAA